MFARYAETEQAFVYLLDGEGKILLTDSVLTEAENASLLRSGEGIADLSGERYMICSEELTATGGRLVLIRPLNEVLSRMQPLRLMLLTCGLLITMLAAVLGVQIINRVGQPLRQLGEMTRLVGVEGRKVYFSEEGTDEVAALARRLNEMNDRLERMTYERQEQTRQKVRFEMFYRQNQINPHFLTNTLNEVRFMAIRSEQRDIAEMVEALGTILEISLRSEEKIPLSTEMKLLDCYVRILRQRYEAQVAVFIRAQSEALNARVPVMVLQPLVENAIMHGMREGEMLTVIVDVAKAEDGGVTILVSDDGQGMELSAAQAILQRDCDVCHIGLANLNRRWQLSFGEASEIQIDTAPGKGFSICLRIPKEDVTCIES